MCLRFRIECMAVVVALLGGCSDHNGANENMSQAPTPELRSGTPVTSALAPGLAQPIIHADPRAERYYDNPEAVTTGRRLYMQFNCSGCHSNGGGGMGPSLMDDVWIYGGRLDQIYQTIVQGRPNGMPTWAGKIPDEQVWQISAYVRSMSLPETLAAQHGPTPSQSPAPVPRSADAHAGWQLPPETTNDFTSTLSGSTQ